MAKNNFLIYTDGGSRGNPGPSAIGAVVGVKEYGQSIGNTTNNIAEYTALIYGLQEALLLNATSIKINTDSQLLYRQVKKIYKIKSPNILGLYNQALRLMSAFKEVSINHISREMNRGADKLATQAVKEQLKRLSSKAAPVRWGMSR